jgi:formylglycine-generating enzyme required for sulfatase activity
MVPNGERTSANRGARGRGAPEVVPIPGGTLGLREANGAIRAVRVAPFWFGRTAVTNLRYAPFLSSGRAPAPPWWNDPRFSAPRQPVVGVNWEEAMAYCVWLSDLTGGRWRLPSEVEWEFAVCGGLSAPRTAWGEAIPPGEIPEGPLEGPWEAGRGTPNGYGLCDIGTIVHEWCLDWEESDRIPRRRCSRGGSWRHTIRWSSPSARSSLPPGFRYSDYGFRVLCESPGPPAPR